MSNCLNLISQNHSAMKKIALIACAIATTTLTSYAQVIAGWDFQTTTNGGTAAVASPNTPTQFSANIGSGSLYLDGTSGSSTWLPATELNAFSGSSVNAIEGLSSTTTGAASLALLGGTSNAANGKSIVFALDLTGITDVYISYSTQATGTGFNLQTWSYSGDGVTFTDFATFAPRTSSTATSFAGIGVVQLPSFSALAGDSTAFVRLTVTGASTSSGNNRLDNVLFTASPVPEPGTVALVALGLGVALFGLRRKRA